MVGRRKGKPRHRGQFQPGDTPWNKGLDDSMLPANNPVYLRPTEDLYSLLVNKDRRRNAIHRDVEVVSESRGLTFLRPPPTPGQTSRYCLSDSIISIFLQTIVPALHISLGVFLKLYKLLETDAHTMDLRLQRYLQVVIQEDELDRNRIEKDQRLACLQPYIQAIDKAQAYETENLQDTIEENEDNLALMALDQNVEDREIAQAVFDEAVAIIDGLTEKRDNLLEQAAEILSKASIKKGKGPFASSLESVLNQFNVHVQAYHCRSFIGNDVHKMLHRSSVFRTGLSSQLVSGKVEFSGKVTQETTKAYCTVLSKNIGSRCSGELKRAWGHHPTDDSKYLKSVSDAKNNILDCFSGNQCSVKCSALSSVCPCAPVASDHVPSYLPRKKYLLLTEEDRMELNEVLDFTMSEAAAMKQRYLRSTSSVEAMHRCMHKSLPTGKSLIFKALAEMRAVGGMGESLARLGQQFGVGPQPDEEIFYNALDEEDILYFDALSLMISKTDLGSSLRGQRGLSLNHVPNLGDYINMKPLDGAEEKLIGASTKDSIKLFTLQTIRHRENAGIVIEEGRLEHYKPTPTLGT
ncbi:Hypp8416 [Branchiostoma lanceolatum]|uniref:Hypp8416 protein n=1 Tax=Branchiostoma lanceolatum TaxID=7740 RepID=A0A8K0EEL9_BRALA|nr:Hypp8416 [Branchiostoma lanceolatum]